MTAAIELSKSDKALIAIYELEKYRKGTDKITVEDVAVRLWKKYPTEFSMKGYPQYPNVDIQKYITKLLVNHLINGGVFNYVITAKGTERAKSLMSGKVVTKAQITSEIRRDIKIEIERILNSKVFTYYTTTQKPRFVESDLFDFMGTSSRSLMTHNQSIFISKYNTITKDVIPFCQQQSKNDKRMEMIVRLWDRLFEDFKTTIEGQIK